MQCRAGCGACCIAPSITSPIPGMPGGKAAGKVCIHLGTDHLCALFDSPDRPSVCGGFQPGEDTCGENFQDAMLKLQLLEKQTGM